MSNAITIRRAVVAAALCGALSVVAAQANVKATFRDVLKPNGHERTKSEQLADGAACGTSGPAHTIETTMPAFEKCMRAKGWVLDHYGPDPSVPVQGTVHNYTDTRGDAEGHPRGDAALHADERACKARGAANLNRCLAESGWKLIYTQHGPAPRRPAPRVDTRPDPTWIDPDTGLRCHNTGFATVCSNYD